MWSLPKKAAHNVLQQSCGLLLNELRDHVAKNSANSVETLIRSAYIIQPMVIKKDLLYNEYSDCLAELGPSLHDAKTERNDLGGKKEVDHIGRIILNKSPNYTK